MRGGWSRVGSGVDDADRGLGARGDGLFDDREVVLADVLVEDLQEVVAIDLEMARRQRLAHGVGLAQVEVDLDLLHASSVGLLLPGGPAILWWSQLATLTGSTTMPTRLRACLSTISSPKSPRSTSPAIRMATRAPSARISS